MSSCDTDCIECSTTDSLRHSRSRINAYKALASPSLICLSSKDPILTAFQLSCELKQLSHLENEFKVSATRSKSVQPVQGQTQRNTSGVRDELKHLRVGFQSVAYWHQKEQCDFLRPINFSVNDNFQKPDL